MKNNFPRLDVSPEIQRKMIEIARQFRKEPTRSESILWQALRGKKLDGLKFRRQQPIGNFIVDFYCSALCLVIEIDGDSHGKMIGYDSQRTRILNSHGLAVLRYSNDDVVKNIAGVYDDLARHIQQVCPASGI